MTGPLSQQSDCPWPRHRLTARLQRSRRWSYAPALRPKLRLPAVQRTGVSLLEVLIAIFVLAIGLLSVASLIPAGQIQVQRSVIQDRQVAIGEQAKADAHARGFFQLSVSGTPAHYLTRFCYPNDPANTYALNAVNTTAAVGPHGFAIDPVFFIQNGDTTQNRLFPRVDPAIPPNINTPGAQILRRVSLQGMTNAAHRNLIDSIFHPQDELAFSVPDDPEEALRGGFLPFNQAEIDDPSAVDPTSWVRRNVEMRYSWLVTVVPKFVGQATPNSIWEASYVIFRQRVPLAGEVNDNNVPLERAVPAVIYPNTTGGTITLNSNDALMLQDIRANNWVLVGGRHRLSTTSAVPQFKWYRVVNADEVIGSGPYSRELTLAGKPWEGFIGTSGSLADVAPDGFNVTCSIFDGVINVRTEQIKFEMPSAWSQ